MNKQQSYSHGLLFSMAPSIFPFLHLQEHEGKDSVDWEAYKIQNGDETFLLVVLNYLKTTAESWGILMVH
jgi:hypothetical protein